MTGLAAWTARRRADPVLRLMKRRAVRHLTAGLPHGAVICDLGCGPGDDAARLARRGFRVRALDADPAMVRLARAHTPVVRASFHAPPAAWRGTCDAVFSFHAADHPPGPAGFAAGARALLRPGGRAVFTASLRGSWQAAWIRLTRFPFAPLIVHGRFHQPSVPVAYAGRRTHVALSGLDDLLALFAPSFDLERVEPLGLLLPGAGSFPGAGRRLPAGLLRRLDAIEARLPFRPFVRLADHALVIVRKR